MANECAKRRASSALAGDARELQNGVTSLVNSLGWVIGPQIGGFVLDRGPDNYHWLMLTTVAIYLVAAGATLGLLGPLERVGSRAKDPA